MKNQKQDKGVAGLTILLSLVVMLFVIGLLVMIFSIMSSKIIESDTLYTDASGTAVNETATVTGAGATLGSTLGLRSFACGTITQVVNATGSRVITAGNYTQVGCNLKNATADAYANNGVGWKVTYPYTYVYDNTGATGVINDTSNALSTTTDWFDIFIVIGAMVVLILLTVVIITAIRGSGMVGGNENAGGKNIGTA